MPVEKRDDNDYELEFRDVSSYPGSDSLILDHLSFKLKVGDKLALVSWTVRQDHLCQAPLPSVRSDRRRDFTQRNRHQKV